MSQRPPSREIKDLIRQVRPHGWTWRMTRSTHVRFDGPEGQVIIASSTPGDRRTHKNLIAEFRRQGCPI